MNNFKRICALLLALIMVMGLSACSRKPSWSYKTDTASYAEGVYIYSLFSAYNEAYSILQSKLGDKFDSTSTILDIASTFDETGEEVLCEDWIKSQADIITKNLAAIDEKIAEYGITLDKTQVESARELAKEDWYLGPYYEYYVASGYEATSYEDMLSPYGVSFDSFFTSSYLASVKQSAIFDHLYGKGGEEEVSDEAITEYFTDNYTSYAYFVVNLYETDIDDDSNQQIYYPYADELIAEVEAEYGVKLEIPIGTMIELPRAAITADHIAKYADFYSFGTNDLTQTCLGFSRDDVESSFLDTYMNEKLIKTNPFATLDRGVARLVQMGVEGGRATNPDIVCGVCGETGGDPDSIQKYYDLGLDYVSCSPFRVPIARLAAAQAKIKSNGGAQTVAPRV